jgi:hypothetical protein
MANKINIENYEAFLLDYMEGTLSTEDLVSLQIFAAQHPHLNIDLNDLELVELSAEEIQFNEKENLKKSPVSDEQFVAYIENQLSSEEKQKLETICLSNDILAKELQLFKKTIVGPDANIVFKNKHSLKKQETKVLWLFSREVLAAAASLLLLFGLWFVFKGNLGTADLNSEKIKGNSTTKTVAIKSIAPAPSYTIEKTTEPVINTNPLAYSNKTNTKEEMVEEKEPKENKTLLTTNNKENAPNTPNIGKEIIPGNKSDNISNNTTKLASNTPNNNPSFIITEKAFDEDEKVVTSNVKKGFWNKAMRALNSLNKLGVKKAKGTETVESNTEQYVLTLGNFKIENHKYNAE